MPSPKNAAVERAPVESVDPVKEPPTPPRTIIRSGTLPLKAFSLMVRIRVPNSMNSTPVEYRPSNASRESGRTISVSDDALLKDPALTTLRPSGRTTRWSALLLRNACASICTVPGRTEYSVNVFDGRDSTRCVPSCCFAYRTLFSAEYTGLSALTVSVRSASEPVRKPVSRSVRAAPMWTSSKCGLFSKAKAPTDFSESGKTRTRTGAPENAMEPTVSSRFRSVLKSTDVSEAESKAESPIVTVPPRSALARSAVAWKACASSVSNWSGSATLVSRAFAKAEAPIERSDAGKAIWRRGACWNASSSMRTVPSTTV